MRKITLNVPTPSDARRAVRKLNDKTKPARKQARNRVANWLANASLKLHSG